MSYSIDDNDNRPMAPLGPYNPSSSLVQGPGWNPFGDPEAQGDDGMSGGSGGSFSLGTGGGSYRGRVGDDEE